MGEYPGEMSNTPEVHPSNVVLILATASLWESTDRVSGSCRPAEQQSAR